MNARVWLWLGSLLLLGTVASLIAGAVTGGGEYVALAAVTLGCALISALSADSEAARAREILRAIGRGLRRGARIGLTGSDGLTDKERTELAEEWREKEGSFDIATEAGRSELAEFEADLLARYEERMGRNRPLSVRAAEAQAVAHKAPRVKRAPRKGIEIHRCEPPRWPKTVGEHWTCTCGSEHVSKRVADMGLPHHPKVPDETIGWVTTRRGT